jgi:hypothetical protein
VRPPARPPAKSAAPTPVSGGCRADHAGQGLWPGIPRRPAHPAGRSRRPGIPVSCIRAGLIRDDGSAGAAFRHDHGIRHPHDLGNRACFTFTTPNRPGNHQPDTTPLCRNPGVPGQESPADKSQAYRPKDIKLPFWRRRPWAASRRLRFFL